MGGERGSSYLWGLRLDLTGTREGAVNLSHDCGCCAFFGCCGGESEVSRALKCDAMEMRGNRERVVG